MSMDFVRLSDNEANCGENLCNYVAKQVGRHSFHHFSLVLEHVVSVDINHVQSFDNIKGFLRNSVKIKTECNRNQ